MQLMLKGEIAVSVKTNVVKNFFCMDVRPSRPMKRQRLVHSEWVRKSLCEKENDGGGMWERERIKEKVPKRNFGPFLTLIF